MKNSRDKQVIGLKTRVVEQRGEVVRYPAPSRWGVYPPCVQCLHVVDIPCGHSGAWLQAGDFGGAGLLLGDLLAPGISSRWTSPGSQRSV